MKVNAETFLEKFEQYKLKETIFFINGNEPSLISKVENIIIQYLDSNGSSEKKFLDFNKNNSDNLKELTKSQSLFCKHNIVRITNPKDSLIKNLNNIDIVNNSILINGEGISTKSKIKKYFDLHKKYYSIACYKLTKIFKKKLIDNFLIKQQSRLTKEAYYYLLENSSDEYQILLSELEKISIYGKDYITINEIKRISTVNNKMELNELFIQCMVNTNDFILKNSGKSIQTSTDAYIFLQIVKKFTYILIHTSEKKIEKNIDSLTDYYLPKYLFKQKNNFKNIIKKTNLNKIIAINNLIQKTELFLKKNEAGFLIIIQRYLLNCSKTLK